MAQERKATKLWPFPLNMPPACLPRNTCDVIHRIPMGRKAEYDGREV